jgi:hypothetical protein
MKRVASYLYLNGFSNLDAVAKQAADSNPANLVLGNCPGFWDGWASAPGAE